ncbi:hypothetical protein SAMN05444362_1216 [Dysgonomonas macrotermitis]|uniref:Uncharacterized protein n=2 Tax=Dysgonomonas macrotermitis TaxID=1346286 RepID=A0A1M5ISR4_9BACT|nr:hypothetical protein SAMN05444362_1216 [Dysgonomonas macrotermitis]
MSDISEYNNGTIKNPCELASYEMPDGRTLIQTIYEDGYVRYNDGWHIVEVDNFCMYVDITGIAVAEITRCNGSCDYEIEDNVN